MQQGQETQNTNNTILHYAHTAQLHIAWTPLLLKPSPPNHHWVHLTMCSHIRSDGLRRNVGIILQCPKKWRFNLPCTRHSNIFIVFGNQLSNKPISDSVPFIYLMTHLSVNPLVLQRSISWWSDSPIHLTIYSLFLAFGLVTVFSYLEVSVWCTGLSRWVMTQLYKLGAMLLVTT